MLGVLQIFLNTGGSRRWIVLVSIVLATLAEGIGIASLLPVITIAIGDEGGFNSEISEAIITALRGVGLEPALGPLLILMLMAVSLKAALQLYALRNVHWAVSDVAADVRRRLIRSVLGVRWAYFARQPIGRLANAISLDASRSAEAFQLAATFLATAFQAAVYAAISLLISWKLALIGLIAGLAIVMVLNPLVRLSKRWGGRGRQRTEELVMLTADALGSIKPLKAMARQSHFEGFFEQRIRGLRRALRRQAMSKVTMRSLREPIIAGLLALGFYIAYVQLDSPLPELLVMGVLIRKMTSTIGEVQEQLQLAVGIEASYWSVHGLIDEAERQREVSRGGRKPTLNTGIELEDVTFGYGETPVLERFSMSAPAGAFTVLSGASGAGKTTITDLILGLHEPQGGAIRLDGVSLAEIDLQAWRSMVGYVPQELGLFHESVLTNVTLGDPTITEEQVVKALELADAWDFVKTLPEGVHTNVGERGATLSGGQRQRIGLARALVLDPKLLILDEVSSALDPETEAEICANIRNLAGQRTIIAITHRPIWINVADRVYQVGAIEQQAA